MKVFKNKMYFRVIGTQIYHLCLEPADGDCEVRTKPPLALTEGSQEIKRIN